MALGKTDIATVRERANTIRNINNTVMLDCWNTFQYILRNLDGWADETVIGNDLKTDMATIVGGVKDNIGQTENWLRTLEMYADTQEQLNSASTN